MSAIIESKPKLPGLITLLLAIALAISLAKLFWLVLTPAQEIVHTPQKNQVASISQTKAINYGKLIADQHIFGKAVVKTTAKPKAKPVKVAKPVPKAKLKIKLYGIVAYKSQQGFALISNNNGPQKVYGKGDTLQKNVTVNDILPTKVLIDNNGTIQELLIPKPNDDKNSKRSNQSVKRSVSNNLPQADNTQPEADASPENDVPDLNQFKQEILSDPTKLTDIVRASPAIINGQFIGFRVKSGKNRKLFRQLNFRANDIITEVNGIVLDDANKGLEVLAKLETATDLAIKVKRGDREVFIDHSF